MKIWKTETLSPRKEDRMTVSSVALSTLPAGVPFSRPSDNGLYMVLDGSPSGVAPPAGMVYATELGAGIISTLALTEQVRPQPNAHVVFA